MLKKFWVWSIFSGYTVSCEDGVHNLTCFLKEKKWDSCYISERASRSLIIYYTINFRLVRHNVLTKKEKSWKYLNFCNCEIVTVLCLDMKLSCTLNDLELHESEMSGEKVFISSYWWSIFQNISFCQYFPFNCK